MVFNPYTGEHATKCSGSKLISKSSGLTWEGAAKSNSWRQVERVGHYDEVGGVLRCSVTACRWNRRDSSCGKTSRRQSPGHIKVNQHSDSKVGSGGGLSIVQSGGPLMGGYTEGEVAIANRKVWTLFSEGDVVVDV